MRKKIFYTKLTIRCFRIISIICTLLLLCAELTVIFKYSQNPIKDWYIILTFFINLLTLIFFVITSIYPQRLGGLSFAAYIYASFIIPFEPENYMGILMFFLGTSLFYVRGLLKKQKKIKLCILIIFILSLLLSHIRFGLNNFFHYIVNATGVILVLGLYTFFIRGHYINSLVYEDKKLNIASYSKLNERDCRILQKIQNGEKYSIIAKEENITEGSLKNRLHFVFSTMEVGDKQGFLSYYDDYELFFESEDVKLPESQEELQ